MCIQDFTQLDLTEKLIEIEYHFASETIIWEMSAIRMNRRNDFWRAVG